MATRKPSMKSAKALDVGPAMQARENSLNEREQALAAQAGVFSNGLSDIVTGLGGPGQSVQLSQTDTLFKNNRWYLVSNMRQLLAETYVEHGLIQTIVDVPVDDAFRGGYDIKSKQLEPEQLEELHAFIDEIGLNQDTLGQAAKWNRLFGGAGIIINNGQEFDKPLNIEAIGLDTPLDFQAVDMWELFADQQTATDYDPVTALPRNIEFYNYYGRRIHSSRVIILKGKTAPSFIRPRLRGWGFSVVEALVRSVNQYLKSNNLAFEVLDEYKLDVFAIKNLTQALMDKGGIEKIQRRVQLANMQKNYQNALVIDSEDRHESKQLSFTGMGEIMEQIRCQLAADMRMPRTKLFGESASGFNSGESDLEVYNGMVESEVRSKMKMPTVRVIKIICQKLFGMIPDDLTIAFRPLRVLSAEQEENVKDKRFARSMQAFEKGRMSAEEFAESCNRDNLLPVQIETADELEDMDLGDEDAENDDGGE